MSEFRGCKSVSISSHFNAPHTAHFKNMDSLPTWSYVHILHAQGPDDDAGGGDEVRWLYAPPPVGPPPPYPDPYMKLDPVDP